MAHPKMFDDADTILHRVQAIAMAYPRADMKVSHGRPAFFTKKVFVYYGGSLRVDGGWVQHPHSIVVLPDGDLRMEMTEQSDWSEGAVYVPAYLGPYGWIGLDIVGSTDWALVEEMIDRSYRLTAPKRAIAELDAR